MATFQQSVDLSETYTLEFMCTRNSALELSHLYSYLRPQHRLKKQRRLQLLMHLQPLHAQAPWP